MIDGSRFEYKWIALSVTTIGTLMAAIDSTIVVLALPDMMVKLHADLVVMIWVIMGYILISTVFLLTFGRHRRKRHRKTSAARIGNPCDRQYRRRGSRRLTDFLSIRGMCSRWIQSLF